VGLTFGEFHRFVGFAFQGSLSVEFLGAHSCQSDGLLGVVSRMKVKICSVI
jgi:hypothetical protein